MDFKIKKMDSPELDGDWSSSAQWIVFSPDILSIVLLTLAIHGMYLGIEVGHPIYSVLFANIIFPLVFTLAGTVAFFFIQVKPNCYLSARFNH